MFVAKLKKKHEQRKMLETDNDMFDKEYNKSVDAQWLDNNFCQRESIGFGF